MPPLKGLAKALLSIERLRRASTTLMRMPLLEEAKALPRGKGGLDIPFWRRVTDFNMPLCIREFDPEKEDWRDYFEQVEQYFVAHALNGDAKEPTKHTLFLSRVGSTTYATPKSLLAPAKPADKMFAVIISTLTKHYSPPPSEVVQSYRFFTSQPTGRDHLCFCGSFVEAGKDCNFGDTVERILQDKIVFSINDEVIQKKLLDEPTNRH